MTTNIPTFLRIKERILNLNNIVDVQQVEESIYIGLDDRDEPIEFTFNDEQEAIDMMDAIETAIMKIGVVTTARQLTVD